jgi:hypothetical protein
MAEQHPAVRSNSRIQLLALALAICGSASMAYYHLGVFIPRMLEVRAAGGLGQGYSWGNDFHPVWLTAGEAIFHRQDPYSPEKTRELQVGVFGRPLDARNPHDPPVQYREFAYPAFTDLVMWPAALLPFPQLRVLLAVLLPLLTIATLGFWVRALDWKLEAIWFAVLVLLTLTTYQVLEALFAEQLGLFVALFLAAAALAIRKEQLMLAGALTSLTLMKPETTCLAVLYLLLWSFSDRSRARFWQGFALVTLALLGGSLLAWPHWIPEWIHIVLGYTRYASPPLIQVLLGKSVPGYIGKAISACLIGAAAVLVWRNRKAGSDSPAFWFTLSLILAITCIAILPGQAIYDHTILIPGIFLVWIHRRDLIRRVPRALLYLCTLILFWPWITAPIVLILRPWIPASSFYSPALFALPIRSAVPLPFAVLALLWWTSRVMPADPESA